MHTETTTPMLPSPSIRATIDFYRALGFEVTYEQTNPNPYACVRWGGIELHFFGLKGFDPAQSYGTCYVSASDVDEVYRSFTSALKAQLGKVPSTGIPRITPLRYLSYGERRFNVVDPGGNWIRIGTPAQESPERRAARKGQPGPLARALELATMLAYSKGDARAAAKVIDTAFRKHEEKHKDEEAPAPVRVALLILRADMAVVLDQLPRARRLLDEARQFQLSAAEKRALAEDLRRAKELDEVLTNS